MATQKRRVIYLSDAEWSSARDGATANAESISAYLGRLVRGAATPEVKIVHAPMIERPFVEFRPAPKPSQRK